MNTHLIKLLGVLLLLLVFPAASCALLASLNERYSQASLFILVVALAGVAAGMIWTLPSAKNRSTTSLADLMMLALGAWGMLIFLGMIPFLGVTDGRLTVAFFEAVSCATTTGSSQLSSQGDTAGSILAWRACLHVLGAALSLTTGILLFSHMNTQSPGYHRAGRFRIGLPRSLSAFPSVMATSVGFIMGLLIISQLTLMANGVELRHAFSIAGSVATTGLIQPLTVEDVGLPIVGYVVVCVGLFLASINATLLFNALRAPVNVVWDAETLGFILLISAMTISLLFLNRDEFAGSLLTAISVGSTSGVLLSTETLSVPTPLIIFFAFVGGAAISSTGGVKVFRFRILLARTGHEISRLSQSHAVVTFQYRGRREDPTSVFAVWVYLITFAVVMLAILALFTLSGQSFAVAVQNSVGTVTNSAALLNFDSQEWVPGPVLNIAMSITMLLGRLELLVLAALILRNSD